MHGDRKPLSSNCPLLEPFAQFVYWAWSAEEVALHFGAAVIADHAVLFDSLDPFGRGSHAERRSKTGNGFHDRRTIAFFTEVLDEAAINLDLVERESPEIAERRIAGAKIVHRDPHAQRAQVVAKQQSKFRAIIPSIRPISLM